MSTEKPAVSVLPVHQKALRLRHQVIPSKNGALSKARNRAELPDMLVRRGFRRMLEAGARGCLLKNSMDEEVRVNGH
jgi:hypothetical protein